MGLLDRVKQALGSNQDSGPDTNEDGKLESIQDQTQEELDLVQFVRKKVEESRVSASRISHEGIWMTNIAYLIGFDSVYYDTQSRQFKSVGRTQQFIKRNRIHVNKILPTVQNRLARLCKNPPQYDVRPNSSNTDDKEAARLSLQILTMVWDRQKINSKRIPLYMWTQQCGHAYVKVSFDDQLGEPMIHPDTQGFEGFEGEVRVDVSSPFEIFPDSLAKTMEESNWFIQAKIRKLDYFKTHYEERGHLVKEEAAWLLSSQYESKINSLNTQGFVEGGASMQKMKGAAIELIYYERRSKKHPNGRMIPTANGVLLDDKDLPVGDIPLVKFDDVLVAGKFYSESIITHLRPIQDQYNRVIQKRADWTNKLLAGKYTAARGSNISSESINDQSGEVIMYDPVANAPDGGKPDVHEVPVIPAFAYQEEKSLDDNINYVAGISDVSRGVMPSAGIPAIGMQLLTEQDDTRIGVMTEANEESWASVGQLILKYVQKFYKRPRLLKIAGANLEYTVKSFTGDEILGNTDVTVIRGSTLPGSKVLRRQEIVNTWQQGLLGDPKDPKVRQNVLDMMEFGDNAEIWLDEGLDKGMVNKTLDLIEKGQVPPVNQLDNHPFFIVELNRFRKGDKFASMSDISQKILVACLQAHVQAMIDLANPPPPPPQVQAQMAANAAQQVGQSPPSQGAPPQ